MHTRIQVVLIWVILAAGAFALADTMSAVSPVAGNRYSRSTGLVPKHYDPPDYFVSPPALGSGQFMADGAGLKWQFASAGNPDLFLANPDLFVPQTGGFCPFAANNGLSANMSPDAECALKRNHCIWLPR